MSYDPSDLGVRSAGKLGNLESEGNDVAGQFLKNGNGEGAM